MAKFRDTRLEKPPANLSEELVADRIKAARSDPGQFHTLERDSEASLAALKRAIAKAQGGATDDRRRALADSEPERLIHLRESERLARVAAGLERLHLSPRVMATLHAMGSEERERFHNQLRGLGPAALESVAADVVARGDKVGAAALIAHVDGMPTASRPRAVDVAAVADALWGEEHRAATKVIAVAKNRFNEALEQNRAFERGRANPTKRIEHALDRAEE